MKEIRLFKIIYYLLDQGRATAPALAEMFDVSVRTIYRDVEALSGAGIPIYTETGRSGGVYLTNDFLLDKVVLSEKEGKEVLPALQSLNAMQDISGNDTLQRLSTLFNINLEDWLEVDFSRWGNNGTDNEKFELLKSAIIHRKNVKILYASSYEAISERVVQPLKLVYKAKAWYLKAFCTKKQEYRIFKLNRIIELKIMEDCFSYRAYPKQKDISKKEYNQVTLRFSKEMTDRVYDEFDRTQVQRQEDGDIIVSAKMPEDAWLIGFLLSCGTQVDIIEPIYLKDVLAEQAKLIYERNKP